MKRRLALVLLAAMLALPAVAADKADPAKEQLRRMQLMQRKLEQEKTQLTQEKTELDGKLKESEGKLDDVRKQGARKAAALQKELATVQADKEALTTKLADTEQRLARLSETQRLTEAERQRLEALSAQLKQSLSGCEAKNESLHRQGVELLQRYEQKGCFDAMLQGDPITGLKRVEIENFVEDNRERLDEQKLGR
jgi:predicted  nucleic acid-binding Zn-ribbon protein